MFSLYGLKRLSFTRDNRVFFSKENPQLASLEKLENTYSRIDNISFIVSVKEGTVLTRKNLAAIEEVTKQAWQIPYSSRVSSLTNFQYTKAEEDNLIVEDLFSSPYDLSDEEMQKRKEFALSDPDVVGNFLSESGKVTMVNIKIVTQGKSKKEYPQIAAYVRKLEESFLKKYPQFEVHIGGPVMVDNAFGEASKSDMKLLVPLMFVLLIVTAGLSLRSIIGTLCTTIIILLSLITGMGLAGWANYTLNIGSVNASTIILTLAIADSIHILVAVFAYLKKGKAKYEAISEAMQINLVPVFLTSATTAIGFLSMNFSDAPPFRDLGNIVSVGVIAAFLYSVFFLPALLSLMPLKQSVPTMGNHTDNKIFDFIAAFVIEKRTILFYGMLIFIFILSLGIMKISLGDNFVKYFSKTNPVRVATDFLVDNLRGWDIIEYSLDSGEEGGICNPEYLKTVEAFSEWWGTQPHVGYRRSIVNMMKRLNRDMNGGKQEYWKVPEDRELAAQYLLLYEMSLPYGQDLNNMINVNKSSSRFIVFFKGLDSKELIAYDKKAQAWLKENAPPSMHTAGSGLSLLWANISARNIVNMLWAAFGALFLISILLIFALRSIKLGLISLIPNLTPAIAAFGLWGFFVGNVGLGLSIVVAMTLGIVVDDTIHFMTKYLRERRKFGKTTIDSVRYSLQSVGPAMGITSLSLIVGFLVLSLSEYKMNSQMGMLSAITIFMALIMDFILLPIILMKVDKD